MKGANIEKVSVNVPKRRWCHANTREARGNKVLARVLARILYGTFQSVKFPPPPPPTRLLNPLLDHTSKLHPLAQIFSFSFSSFSCCFLFFGSDRVIGMDGIFTRSLAHFHPVLRNLAADIVDRPYFPDRF